MNALHRRLLLEVYGGRMEFRREGDDAQSRSDFALTAHALSDLCAWGLLFTVAFLELEPRKGFFGHFASREARCRVAIAAISREGREMVEESGLADEAPLGLTVEGVAHPPGVSLFPGEHVTTRPAPVPRHAPDADRVRRADSA